MTQTTRRPQAEIEAHTQQVIEFMIGSLKATAARLKEDGTKDLDVTYVNKIAAPMGIGSIHTELVAGY